jgi:hypothetical protein
MFRKTLGLKAKNRFLCLKERARGISSRNLAQKDSTCHLIGKVFIVQVSLTFPKSVFLTLDFLKLNFQN